MGHLKISTCLGVRFLSLAKKMENPNFFEIVPHLHTAPRAFFESRPPINIDRNRTISARYAMLVFIHIYAF